MKVKFPDQILFEDDDFLVANKPPFLSTLEDRGSNQNLQALAKSYLSELSACHRLDKETSGCVLFAKHDEAYRSASIQFEKRKVIKEYHAFVDGIHEFDDLVVDLPILPLAKGSVIIDTKKGKPSKTSITTLALYKKHSLIACYPESGRMHQIRIHLAQKEAPIINDALYGGKDLFLSEIKKKYRLSKDAEEQPLIKRFALHAHALTFTKMNGEKEKVEAAYPKDLRVLEKQLEANRF